MASPLGDVAVTDQGASQLGNGDGEPETEHVARPLGDVALTSQGVRQSVNGDGEPRFDPIQLWLMLFQAEYEPC